MNELNIYGSVAYSTLETIYNTYEMTTLILDNNISGCIVECGVAMGAQIATAHRCCLDKNNRRKIFAFDSYEGIPIACENDDQQPGIGDIKEHVKYTNKRELLKTSGITVCPLNGVINLIKRWFPRTHHDFNYIKGWFQDTVINFKEPIALLRLDGDLYESTKVCLENLFPLLQPNGVLIIDDWALTGCQKACIEYFKNVNVKEIEPTYKTPGPKYFQKIE
jgi:O-methyltransferase